MFARYREGDPVKLGEVAEYCIKDTLLPHKLMKKMCILLNLGGDGQSYLGSNVFPR
jgi:DNA polymerase delta subunit 1